MSSPDSSRLLSLLAQWEQGMEAGSPLTPEELCKNDPELLGEVRSQLARLLHVHQIMSDETKVQSQKQPIVAMDEAPTIMPSGDTSPEVDGGASKAIGKLPQIPGFHIESELGRGGMGVVYLARQVRLNRLVALKMIISGDHANSETKLRFLAEAEAIAKLHHPGIVQVHEFGTHDDNPYFALEYISGGSLDKKLAGNPLPPREAAELVEKLARAVQSAHDAGIIHRDLKPANILMADDHSNSRGSQEKIKSQLSTSKSWQPKITDFGLVKNVGSDMTATGQILGTPSYMAPEQADGKKSVGPAADIYALGAILYECLTGRAPFKAATPLDTLLQVLNDEPVSLRQLQAKTPMDLETICHKCLQKEPSKRYGSAAELAEDLGRYLRHEPIAARPVGRAEKVVRWCRRYPAVAGLVVVLLLGAVAAALLAGWAYSERSIAKKERANAIAEQQHAVDEGTRADQKAKEAELAKQASDREAARADEQAKSARRYLGISRADRGLREYTDGNLNDALLWFVEQGVIDSDATTNAMVRRRIRCYRQFCRQPTLHNIFIHNWYIGSTQMADSARRVFEKADLAIGGINAITVPAICIEKLYAVVTDNNYTSRVWNLATNQPVSKESKHSKLISHVSISNDGFYYVTACRDGSAQIWDTMTGDRRTPPLKHPHEVTRAVFSADGYLIATICGDNCVRIWNAQNGKQITAPLPHPASVEHVMFTPDNKHVVCLSNRIISVWNATTGKPVLGERMTEVSNQLQPKFVLASSVTGKIIVLNKTNAMIVDISTGTVTATDIHHGGNIVNAKLSNDRSMIITSSNDKTARVWSAISGRAISPPLLHKESVVNGCISPDCRYAATSSSDNTTRIWNISTGKEICESISQRKPNSYLAFTNSGDQLITSCDNMMDTSSTMTWNIAFNSGSRDSLRLNSQPVFLEFSHDGKRIEAITTRGACVFDASTKLPVTPEFEYQNEISHGEFSADGRFLLTTQPSITQVWDAATGKQLFPSITTPAKHVSFFSKDGSRIITKGKESQLTVRESTSGTIEIADPTHTESFISTRDGHVYNTSKNNQYLVTSVYGGRG